MLDAGVLCIYEHRFRPVEKHEPKWLEHQTDKINRTLAAFEESPPAIPPIPDVGTIALASALGYLDFRFDGIWRKTHPKLVKWLGAFSAKVPSFAETKPA